MTTSEDPDMNPANESAESSGSAARDEPVLEAKHKVFLSHSGAQKNFVEQLCVDIERHDRYPFFDKRRDSLGIGEHFPKAIFRAIRQCQVGLLILSEEFFTRTKWPMLELAAMVESMEENSELVIMPVFLSISREECRSVKKHKEWESTWLTWKQTDPRIDVEKWMQALSIFGPTNGLIYKEVLGEVQFREEIVEAICGCIPPETRWDDSHVQGRLRLCQDIREKVKTTQVCKSFGVRVIGLYGVGGLGKTTICKTLCNDYFEEFQGRVAHVEFESDVEVELMREVLRKLTDTRREVLALFKKGESITHLKAKVHKHKVFLAIDNVCETKEAIEQARVYLSVGFSERSVVIVTARSKDVLKGVGLSVEDCVKMPKLDTSEAKSLFLHQVLGLPDIINAQDEACILDCVKVCRFWEGDESGFGYHPLALKLLGIQSSMLGYDPKGWVEGLPHNSNEVMGSVFKILRRSFDALEDGDKLLFMDAVLYYRGYRNQSFFQKYKLLNIFEWLSIVHERSVNCMKSRLQELKKKSLIEDVSDRVCVHDLWREFAIKETKAGQLEFRRWVYVMDDEKSEFDEVLPSGIRWGALRRMCFIESQEEFSDKVVNVIMLTKLMYCSNVTVLHLLMKHKDLHNVKMLDLTPLNCLKNLMLEGCNKIACEVVSGVEVRGLGTLKSLGYLSWTDHYISSASMKDIMCLTSLKYLRLSNCIECEKLLDLSNLKLLRGVQLDIERGEPFEVSGFSSKMTKLKRLSLKFRHRGTCTCHGIPNLMALEELEIEGAVNAKEVFNLQVLTNLRMLTIRRCRSIRELLGFDDIVALNSLHPGRSAVSLEELTIEECPNLRKLPHIGMLTNLRILNIWLCPVQSLVGLAALNSLHPGRSAVSLEELTILYCPNLRKLPHIGKLTNLRILSIWFCPIQSLAGLGELVALEVLEAQDCSQLSEIPDLHQLSNLKRLNLQGCPLRTVRGLDGLEALDSLTVRNCVELVALPGLCWVRDLKVLDITECSSLKPLPSLESLHNLRVLKGDWQVVIEPHKLPAQLEELTIEGRGSMDGFKMLIPAISESRLDCRDVDELNALPALPGVNSLCLFRCNFRAVSGLINRTALRKLDIQSCYELEGLHDLPLLKTLHISHSHEAVIRMIDMGFLPELETLELCYLAVTELPDLSSCCPKLSRLVVIRCEKLRSLKSSAPLIALTSLRVVACRSLRELPDLTLSTKLKYAVVWGCGVRLRTPKDSSSPISSWPNVEWEAVP